MALIHLDYRCSVVVALAVLAAGCAPRPMPLAADHPANPEAEPGRLVGAPAALRPDVAQVDEPPPRATATPSHDHGGHGAAPDPAKVKADLLAAETTAYENARPLFEKYCASCHSKGQKGAKPKTLAHFEITTYPFGGHHAMEVGKNVRKVLGIGGGKPTMPKTRPGIVKGDELALFAVWADAFDAAHAGGAHEGHGTGGHDHSSSSPSTPPPANTKKPTSRAKPAAPTRFDIAVTSAGFEPKNVTVPRGKPVVLRFERRIERTCGTEVVMVVDGQKIVKDLPLNQPVELAITFGTAGTVKYSCSMDMIRGTITVQ